ncbi:MAG: hypothetical protein AB1498_11615 [bacterium]
MVRMADILKKQADKKEVYDNLLKKTDEKTEIQTPVMENGKIYSRGELEKIYYIVADFVEYIYDKIKEKKSINGKDEEYIFLYIETFVDQLLQGNDELLGLFNLPSKEVFIYNHVVNVCILSIDVGIGLGYDKSRLTRLGILALFHDIGITQFYNLITQPRKLTDDEYCEVKNGSITVREYLSNLKDGREIINWVNSVIDQNLAILENMNRKPDESTYIITIVEIYEAMTHMRPYREKIHPFEALRELIERKESYEEKILKVLIERIGGPYPVDTNVKMNSGEDGRVIKRNLGFLLRPVVEITHDVNGKKLNKSKIIDLIKQPTQFIKRHLKEEEIHKES